MQTCIAGFNVFIYPSPKRECLNHGVVSKPGVVLATAAKTRTASLVKLNQTRCFVIWGNDVLSLLSYLCLVRHNERVNITMSFGFSVGDFIAAIELCNKIRREFVDAPSQFKAISDEYVA